MREPTPYPSAPATYDPEAQSDAPKKKWYGYQIMLIDGARVLFIASGSEGAVFLGGLGLVLSSPIVHGAHGRSRGLGGLGMRAGGALILGAAGGDSIEGALTGFVVGWLIGAGIDYAFLSHEPAPASASVSVQPVALVRPDGTMLGVGGTW
jgi:hypothetical protein